MQEIGNITSRLIPVPHWNQHHQWPTQSGLRYWIFHAKTNGFDKVLRRVGRRVLIDEAAFFEWVNNQNQQGGGNNEIH